MIRPAALWIALRYLRSQPANQFAALVGLASVIGVALGVAALIVVLSVMNGFENELRGRLVAITGHAVIQTGDSAADWRRVLADVQGFPGVASAVPYVEVEAMLASGSELSAAAIEGVDPDAASPVGGPGGAMLIGSVTDLQPGSFRMLLGRSLALRLGVDPGDRVRVLVPIRDSAGRVATRLREFTVAGSFEVGVKDHDAVRALVNIEDAAILAGLSQQVSGIRLQAADIFAAPQIIRDWSSRWVAAGGQALRTTDWTVQNATYFRAVRIEKTMMTLLLSLIVAVAAFNIVATLVMIVTDKRPGIAILRTVGFSRRAVMTIFAAQGLLIGWLGVAIGVVTGVMAARNVGSIAPALERAFGFQFMPADVYYLTSLPSDIHFGDVFWVGIIAVLMTGCATLYPAFRAAGVAPAEVLRYE